MQKRDTEQYKREIRQVEREDEVMSPNMPPPMPIDPAKIPKPDELAAGTMILADQPLTGDVRLPTTFEGWQAAYGGLTALLWIGTGGCLGWVGHVIAAATAHNRGEDKERRGYHLS